MSEIDRIRNMAADGTITSEEADRLIALLAEIDTTEADVDAVAGASAGSSAPDLSRARTEPAGATSDSTGSPSGPAGRGTPNAGAQPETATGSAAGSAAGAGASSAAAHAPSSGEAQAPTLGVPAHVSWFKIETLAGDIDVRVDDTLEAPEVDGPEGVSIRETADGHELVYDEGRSFFDRLVSGRIGREFHVRIPADTGVDLRIKAGDLDLRDVPYVKGHILAGDVSATGLRGIALSMSAGDLDLSLRPTEGEHRITMTAGDVDVRLEPGSDVRVTGRVNIGDAAMPKGFESRRSGLGESFSGTVGSGTASLEIHQSTGDVNVSVES